MNYKYLTDHQKQKIINVLCGYYNLKNTLQYIDDILQEAYDKGYERGYDIGRDVLY